MIFHLNIKSFHSSQCSWICRFNFDVLNHQPLVHHPIPPFVPQTHTPRDNGTEIIKILHYTNCNCYNTWSIKMIQGILLPVLKDAIRTKGFGITNIKKIFLVCISLYIQYYVCCACLAALDDWTSTGSVVTKSVRISFIYVYIYIYIYMFVCVADGVLFKMDWYVYIDLYNTAYIYGHKNIQQKRRSKGIFTSKNCIGWAHICLHHRQTCRFLMHVVVYIKTNYFLDQR